MYRMEHTGTKTFILVLLFSLSSFAWADELPDWKDLKRYDGVAKIYARSERAESIIVAKPEVLPVPEMVKVNKNLLSVGSEEKKTGAADSPTSVHSAEFEPDQEFSIYLTEVPALNMNNLSMVINGKAVNFKSVNLDVGGKRLVIELDEFSVVDSLYTFGKSTVNAEITITDGKYIIHADNIKLKIFDWGWMTATSIFLLILLGSLLYLSYRTGMIRNDRFVKSDDGHVIKINDVKSAFSLSRTQLAFWTVIVLTAFLYNFAITGDLPVLDKTVMILLGFGIATRAVSEFVDQKDIESKAGDRHQDESSVDFFSDILSNSSGISIHRFQFVAFNLVYGIYFLYHVFATLEFKGFSDEALVLMGVIQAGYAIPKLTENKTAQSSQAAKATNPG